MPYGRMLTYGTPQQPTTPQEDPTVRSAIAGPLRVLFGSAMNRDVEVPACDVTRAPVQLARNDSQRPKCVQIRLARRSTASTIALFPTASAQFVPTTGGLMPVNGMTVHLRPDGEQSVTLVLENGDQIWALGVWPGTVPRSVWVTVLEYA
jgi:hypothetical protein